MNKKILPLILMLIFSISAFSADRYWISNTATNWNNTANWSTSSGGPAGTSVPGIYDKAIFDCNGLGNCSIDITVTVEGLDLLSGYSGTIDVNGQIFLATGTTNYMFDNGAITDSGAGSFTINTTGNITFRGTSFEQDITATGHVRLDGSLFNGNLTITHIGSGSIYSLGGNTYNGVVNFTASQTSGYFYFGGVNIDIFNDNIIVGSSVNQQLVFGNSAISTLATW